MEPDKSTPGGEYKDIFSPLTDQTPAGQTLPVATSVSAFTTQQSFSHASFQFATLQAFQPNEVHHALDKKLTDQSKAVEVRANGTIGSMLEFLRVQKAIDTKASSLGYPPNAGLGDITSVPGGYFRRYPNHDIYSTSAGACFEVHGEIRAKYNALGGASGLLGMPQTDESGTPDGIGRFNHFKGGSIYYTSHTGPMAVWGTVRDRWAATNWERGPFGYPVQDQHRMVSIPATAPVVEWCRFENGVIAGDAKVGRDALPATLTYAELGALFGARLNQQFQASPDNVALRSGIELTGVTNWQYNFWASVSRSIGFRFRGFHDNGLAPDTNFAINIDLRFELVWAQTFTEPTQKSLVAVLEFLRVVHEGGPPVVGGKVVSGVTNAIHNSFFPSVWPDPAHPEVPQGAIFVADVPTGATLEGSPENRHTRAIDVLDVLITAGGDLQVLVNPLRPPNQLPTDPFDMGKLRQVFAQNILDGMKV